MAWRDQLRPGSFRGVKFLTQGHDLGGGRRVEVHEFPQRDDPFTEDLGRSARRYGLEAFVLGGDYMAQRDALLAACEDKGPATLIHPYLGSLVVQCVTVSMSERADEGGMAVFQLSFVEAGIKPAPSIGDDTQTAALGAADRAEVQLSAGFAERFAPSMRGFVAEAMGAVVKTAAGTFTGLGAGVLTDTARFTLGRAAGSLGRDALSLVGAPAALATQVMGLGRLVRDAAPAADGLRLMSGLMTFGSDLAAVPGATPARQQQRANQAALVGLVRQAGAVGAVRSAAQTAFSTFDEAVAQRAVLAEAIDDLALDAADAGDDVAYGALGDLRQAMVRDLTARGASLARISSFAPAAPLPALVIAHRLYGDASRDQELIARNAARHPAFMGESPLQVLIDA